MIFRLLVPLLVIFFAFLYIALLNPGTIPFTYAGQAQVTVPLIVVVMLSFLAGTLSVSALYLFRSLGEAVGDLSASVARWRAERLEALLRKARKKAGEGKYAKAIGMLERILAKRPGHFDSQMFKGDILRKMGHPEDALRAHSVALSIRPADLNAIFAIKEDYLACGKPLAAYRMLEQLRGREPHNPALLSEMRDFSVETGELHRAAALQKEIVSLAADPETLTGERLRMAEIHCLYGSQLMVEGNYERAREAFELAAQIEPEFLAADILESEALVRLERVPEAAAVLRKWFKASLSPLLALRLAGLPGADEAEVYSWASAVAPEEPVLKLLLTIAKIRRRDYVGASALINQWSAALNGFSGFEVVKAVVERVLADNPSGAELGRLADSLEVAARALARCKCQACDAVEDGYFHQCPSCGHWNTATLSLEGVSGEKQGV